MKKYLKEETASNIETLKGFMEELHNMFVFLDESKDDPLYCEETMGGSVSKAQNALWTASKEMSEVIGKETFSTIFYGTSSLRSREAKKKGAQNGN